MPDDRVQRAGRGLLGRLEEQHHGWAEAGEEPRQLREQADDTGRGEHDQAQYDRVGGGADRAVALLRTLEDAGRAHDATISACGAACFNRVLQPRELTSSRLRSPRRSAPALRRAGPRGLLDRSPGDVDEARQQVQVLQIAQQPEGPLRVDESAPRAAARARRRASRHTARSPARAPRLLVALRRERAGTGGRRPARRRGPRATSRNDSASARLGPCRAGRGRPEAASGLLPRHRSTAGAMQLARSLRIRSPDRCGNRRRARRAGMRWWSGPVRPRRPRPASPPAPPRS